jgi:hypothetical protein
VGLEGKALIRNVAMQDPSRPAIRVVLFHAAMLAAAVWPFLVLDAADGLVDAPNAIGRIAAGLRVLAQAPAQAFYVLQYHFIPNMAVDVWGLATGGWLGPARAVNLFTAGSIVIGYTGIQALRVVLFGAGSRIVGALSVFLAYGLALRWGFLNFVFASALLVWAIAHLERRLKTPDARYFALGQTILLSAIYCSSLLPAFLYVVYVSVRLIPDAWRAARTRAWPVLLRLAVDHGTGIAVLGVLFLASRTTPPWGGGSEWLWSRKQDGLASLLWFQAEPFEQLVGVAAVASTGILVAVLRPRLDRTHVPAVLALLAVFFIIPFYLNGVAFADTRLLAPIVGLVAGLARFGPVRTMPGRIAAAVLTLACVAKPVAFVRQVEPVLAARAALADVLAGVQEGSFISLADGRDGPLIGNQVAGHLPLIHLAQGDFRFRGLFQNYFIRDRFADADDVAAASGPIETGAGRAGACSTASYILVIGALPPAMPQANAERVAQKGPFTLLRRLPAGPCAST